ncbi:hypothetical protein [Cellulophaga sp. BC115SP]|uniref:hypothetical protein n=1 Tax=Cellulophaga sp. BC115SP TaxID=2683263 RepID=UPI0014124765|nr:hypothetical protein [Cellulophaga sp. BC115SP]NBB30661.1 hypothetical protein [Cellulophaga sp. BC115SP]
MELKIINLRDLDSQENQDIVEIISEVMNQKYNHSAYKAVQHIIRTYKRQESEINKLRNELQKLKKENEQSQKEQSDTINELLSAIEGFNKFLIVANKVTPKK